MTGVERMSGNPICVGASSSSGGRGLAALRGGADGRRVTSAREWRQRGTDAALVHSAARRAAPHAAHAAHARYPQAVGGGARAPASRAHL